MSNTARVRSSGSAAAAVWIGHLVIVATAGHVDHGKTSLVQALTGINTDRLPEEQRRGMTIELGFAYADWALDLPRDGPALTRPIAFVDVPGHEGLVRTMLAGVTGIDVALLVVAADDGLMPQTLEHLALLTLLGVPQLVVVLSKTDRVAAPRLQQVALEVQGLLAGGPYAAAPQFAVAAPSGQGLPALRQYLTNAAGSQQPRPALGQFRLAIDRSFTRAGAGRVVTGTVLSGQVRVGDVVVVSPSGAAARVRGLQAHHQAALLAQAGERCAMNLTGALLKRTPPERGDWVLAPAAHRPTQRLDVQLQVLASAAAPLRPRSELQLHLGAAVVNVQVAALGGSSLAPGSTGLAQLVLTQPVTAAYGDRFVLRDPAANRSLAGGWVVDPFGPARGRLRPQRLAQLDCLRQPDITSALSALLAMEPHGVHLPAFAQAHNLRPDEAEALYQKLALPRATHGEGWIGLSPFHRQQRRAQLLTALAQWHLLYPDHVGPQSAELAAACVLLEALPQALPQALFQALLANLVQDQRVVAVGLRLRLVDHQPVLSEADSAVLSLIQALLVPAGLRPPIVGELATQLAMPVPALLETLARLTAQGHLVRVAPNRYYLPATVNELIAQAHALAAAAAGAAAEGTAAASIDAAGYRDHTGIGRNLTVQVLEFFKREGLTRFDGTRHWLLSPATREPGAATAA